MIEKRLSTLKQNETRKWRIRRDSNSWPLPSEDHMLTHKPL